MDILGTLATTVLPALLPGVGHVIGAVANKLTGNAIADPVTVEDRIRIAQADTERLKAIAAMDTVANVHTWVNDVRALQRPVAAGLIISGLLYVIGGGGDVVSLQSMEGLASSVIFYMFGDRTILHFKRKEQ